MITDDPAENYSVVGPNSADQNANCQPWSAPKVTKLQVSRTLNGSGTGGDGPYNGTTSL